MNNNIIKLTESDVHRIVKESIEKILMEFKDSGFLKENGYNAIVKALDGTEAYVKDIDFFKCFSHWKHDSIALSRGGKLFYWAETRNGIPVYYEDDGYLNKFESLRRWREENM